MSIIQNLLENRITSQFQYMNDHDWAFRKINVDGQDVDNLTKTQNHFITDLFNPTLIIFDELFEE